MVNYIIKRFLTSEKSKATKIQVAFWIMTGSVVAWPLSTFTIFRSQELVFHFILGISWLTQITTCWDFLTTSMVHEENGNGGANNE